MSPSRRAPGCTTACGCAGLGDDPLCVPMFSIITACQNQAATIEACVASVAEQRFTSVEHVIVDRHSRDDSLSRIHGERDRLSIVYGSAADSRYRAWNRGIGQAQGEILGFLDADDTLAGSDVLQCAAGAFAEPGVAAVCGDLLRVDARDLRLVKRRHRLGPPSAHKRARGWVPPIQALFVRKRGYRQLDSFSLDLGSAAGHAALLRLFAQPTFHVVYLGEPVVRQRAGQPGLGRMLKVLREPVYELRALRHTGLGGWQTWAWQRWSTLERWL